MDGYIPHPPAQDLATAGYSSAAKGGLAGVLVMLLLAIVFYVFFKCRNCSMKFEEMRIAREDGLRWRSVGLALWSTEALIFYYKENFLAKRDLEEGRDRRRLKLSTLTDYGKEQDMEIEALEAMLMDLEVRSEFWAFE
ncbi:hypothetical protein D5086_022933 [Populus alba]|uniref:Uncharacterized protein n=1 Tax=Populus alba TaxID=43335 RepID=A0ACC4B8Y2_POPAL